MLLPESVLLALPAMLTALGGTAVTAGGLVIGNVGLAADSTARILTLAGLGGGITVNGVVSDGSAAGSGLTIAAGTVVRYYA